MMYMRTVNPFNGIERWLPLRRALRFLSRSESIQWNWKAHRSTTSLSSLSAESIQWNWKDPKSGELDLRTSENPFNGIESEVLGFSHCSLKCVSMNPFNGIERVVWPWHLGHGQILVNPFNGIESTSKPAPPPYHRLAGIHSMELKERSWLGGAGMWCPRGNPFNGIERPSASLHTWGISTPNPFNGIERRWRLATSQWYCTGIHSMELKAHYSVTSRALKAH